MVSRYPACSLKKGILKPKKHPNFPVKNYLKPIVFGYLGERFVGGLDWVWGRGFGGGGAVGVGKGRSFGHFRGLRMTGVARA
jgi:hypothetical protein